MEGATQQPVQWVALARISHARGIKGEVACRAMGSAPERIRQAGRVYLVPPGRAVEVENVWLHREELILKFRGIDTRNEAETLRGCDVAIPLAERPPAPAGEVYYSDLAGCEVWSRSGKRLGVVIAWEDQGPGSPGLLRIDGGPADGELLIPFVRSICYELDLVRKRIQVDPPEGLLDLNRP